MRHTILVVLLLSAFTTRAQPFNWQWSRSATSDQSAPTVYDMAVDAMGNSYITGYFFGTAQWGDLPSITALGVNDVYVVKYDPNGTALWVAQGGGVGEETAKGVTVDALGNVYITGYFSSATAAFGSNSLSVNGPMDIFCAKLDASGQWLWAKQFGSANNGQEMGEDIVATPDGSTIVTGAFKYYLPLDGMPQLEGCSQVQDLFLLRLDTDGEPIWARHPDCTHDDSYGTSTGQKLVLDGLGNIYLGAKYRGDTCFFETDTLLNQQLSSGQTFDGLLAKYTLDGDFQWVRFVGGYGYDDVYALATDTDGNCYVAMHRESQYNLPEFQVPVSGTLGIYRAVLLKASPTGEFLWAERMGNSGYDHAITGVAVDTQADILLSGWYEDRMELGDVVLDGSGPHYGLFVARFNADHSVEEVFTSRTSTPRRAAGVALDPADNLYVVGSFSDTLTFPGTPTLDVPAQASFVARSGDTPTSIAAHEVQIGPVVFPLPSNGRSTVRSDELFTGLRIWNTTGTLVADHAFTATRSYDIALAGPGAYTYRITLADGRMQRGKLIVVR